MRKQILYVGARLNRKKIIKMGAGFCSLYQEIHYFKVHYIKVLSVLSAKSVKKMNVIPMTVVIIYSFLKIYIVITPSME